LLLISSFVPQHPRITKIDDYGLVGDCRAVALISRYGSIDWLCWPRFDSPAIFASILDAEKGGFWSIAPVQICQCTRAYIGDSNVLQTEFLCSRGRATLTDTMTVSGEDFKRANLVPDHELLRQITCTEGEMEIEIDFEPRANYGATSVHIRDLGAHGLRIDLGRGAYWLRSSIPLKVLNGGAHAPIVMKRGQTLQFSFSYAEESPAVLPALGERAQQAIDRSVDWWQKWAARSRYRGPYREAVLRSALALKLLAYAPSGAVVAAATTSLPERIGADLNWDYRYCWLRDASLTTRALLGLGFLSVAESQIGRASCRERV